VVKRYSAGFILCLIVILLCMKDNFAREESQKGASLAKPIKREARTDKQIEEILTRGTYEERFNVLKDDMRKYRKRNEKNGRYEQFIQEKVPVELRDALENQLKNEVGFWQNKKYDEIGDEIHWKAYKELLSDVAWLKDENTIPLLVDALNTPCGLKVVEDTLVEFRAQSKELLLKKFNSEDTYWKHRYSSVLWRITQEEKKDANAK